MVAGNKELLQITQLRDKAGLTQAELAQMVDVSENTIANWERGSASKWIVRLIKLCRALNCDLQDLMPNAASDEQEIADLTENTLEPIKSYFLYVLGEDKKQASKIASFASMHDKNLRYWLNQVDWIIEESKQVEKPDLSFESVASRLSLQNLVNQLKQPYSSPKEVTLEKFSELVGKVNLDEKFIQNYVAFRNENFTRQLILQTWTLTVYVIGWKPGQKVLMHHHGNSLDAIKVIQGEMTHWLLSEEDCLEQKVPFEGCLSTQEYIGASKTLFPGELIFVDRCSAHQIANCSEQDLVTLHFRFGSPPDDDKWDDKDAKPYLVLEDTQKYQLKQQVQPHILGKEHGI